MTNHGAMLASRVFKDAGQGGKRTGVEKLTEDVGKLVL